MSLTTEVMEYRVVRADGEPTLHTGMTDLPHALGCLEERRRAGNAGPYTLQARVIVTTKTNWTTVPEGVMESSPT